MSVVLHIFFLLLCSALFAHNGYSLSYSGILKVDGKRFEGKADFSFSIIDANDTQIWQSGSPERNTIPLVVKNGRYSIELGGQLTQPLPDIVFLHEPDLKLRICADLGNGMGLQSVDVDIPIYNLPHARFAQRVKNAKVAKVADNLRNESVTDAALSAGLRAAFAKLNEPNRLGSEKLSASHRKYFENDFKPKFTFQQSSKIEIMTGFDNSLISDMSAWYSSDQIEGNLLVGDKVTFWNDRSGNRRHFSGYSGNPVLENSVMINLPVVAFGGDDLLWTANHFDLLTESGYSIVSLARYTGKKNGRVISSRNRNFSFGFHSNSVCKWQAEGWIYQSNQKDSDWHIHVGRIDAKGGDPSASFWIDGERLTTASKGSSNSIFSPGQLQLGGYKSNSELSSCEVAEIMIFNRQISDGERQKIEGYLAHKWRVKTPLLRANHPYFAYNPYGEEELVNLNAPTVSGKDIVFSWKKNGEVIANATTSSLAVPPSESADYSLYASNLFGSDEYSFSVTVTTAPTLPDTNRSTKPDVSDLINRKVVASWFNTFYIDENGSLWGCGRNSNGSLGLGHTSLLSEFERIIADNVASVSTRSNQTFFIREDGSLWGMGSNNQGQLGLGLFGGSRNTPVEIVDRGVIDVVAGWEHTLFVKHDGSLWGMGRNVKGQLGIGNNDRQHSPVKIMDANVISIACSSDNSYALLSDGSLWSWGNGFQGKLGDGKSTNRNLPYKIVDANVTQVSAGEVHVQFLKNDGSAWAFGTNWDHMLGDGTGSHRLIPIKVMDENITAVVTGSRNSYFLKNNGTLWGSGMSRYGAMGQDTFNSIKIPALVAENVNHVFGSHEAVLFTKKNQGLYGLGNNRTFKLGGGGHNNQYKLVKVLDGNVSYVASGYEHSVLLKKDGSVFTMGSDGDGRLGNGRSNRHESYPQKIIDENATRISTFFKHTLVMKDDGSLWGFGRNVYGQLGDGTKTNRNIPVQIMDANVSACAAGENHSLFVLKDGSLWGMGENHKGQLGDGTTTNRKIPVKIMDAHVSEVTAGQHFSLFLKNDGSVWSMGSNQSKRLGNGNDQDEHRPVMIMASGAVAIDSGVFHSLVLKADGSLWAFGSQGNGRLGLSKYGDRNIPSMVVEKGVVAISAGGNHSLFVKDDGSVWGMGSNYDGQLGLDKNSDNNWPIRIIESEAKSVEASRNNSSFIVMKDGSLFGLGKDDHGQLGTGRTITNYLPVLVSERIKE